MAKLLTRVTAALALATSADYGDDIETVNQVDDVLAEAQAALKASADRKAAYEAADSDDVTITSIVAAAVTFEDKPLTLNIGGVVEYVKNLGDAQRVYLTVRDNSDEGAANFQNGIIQVGDSEIVIKYDGTVWLGDKRLMDAPVA